MHHDLVIRNGTVVDGTGQPRFIADVAVDNGVISALGIVSRSGKVELDATNLIVAPGWVDIHTHYDGQVSWDPFLTPSSWHGVTTAVMGNCGVGFAPVAPDRRSWLIEVMEGIEDIPGTALHEGITWGWETFPEYLDIIDASPHAIDFAAQIGHAALRGYVMGDRGADHQERATLEEIAIMGAIVADAIRAGAIGFTTSRTVAHRSADGRHTPSLTASREELLGIAEAIGATGAGVIEIVADFFDLDTEFALIRDMASVSGRPISVSILQRPEFAPDEYRRILDLIATANSQGLRITGQVAARPVGLIMSLEGRVNPLLPSATYQSLLGLALVDRKEALRELDTRQTIITEVENSGADMGGLTRMMFALTDPVRYDQSLDECLDIAGAYDTLLSEDGNGKIYVPVMNFVEGDMRATREMIAHPNTVPGLGDAGAHCTMICDASFPTWMLQFWGRDAAKSQQFEIEWLVKQQASDTAMAVGFYDRGTLEVGMRADINLIDLAALEVGSPEMLHDLPAEGKRLVQRAIGYRSTIVAGTVIMNDGIPTGELPGRLVRGEQSAPSVS
ncbi:MAG: amidohydrolase family protein [Acidimicrobiales bacterium]